MSNSPSQFRLPDITKKQLEELQDATGVRNLSQIVAMAIDRMHAQEVKSKNAHISEIDIALRYWFTPRYIEEIKRDGNAVAELDRLARENNTSRFAIIDEALEFYEPQNIKASTD